MINIKQNPLDRTYSYELCFDDQVILHGEKFKSWEDILHLFSNIIAALDRPINVVDLPYRHLYDGEN